MESFTLLGDFVYSIHFFFHWEALDKTYVYENSIGNIVSVKAYAYTSQGGEPTGDYTQKVYT